MGGGVLSQRPPPHSETNRFLETVAAPAAAPGAEARQRQQRGRSKAQVPGPGGGPGGSDRKQAAGQTRERRGAGAGSCERGSRWRGTAGSRPRAPAPPRSPRGPGGGGCARCPPLGLQPGGRASYLWAPPPVWRACAARRQSWRTARPGPTACCCWRGCRWAPGRH